MSVFSNPPEKLKSISYFFKLAEDHQEKYIAVSYWCAFHALNCGLKINAKEENAEATVFMKNVLKWLEDVKQNNPKNLAITDDEEAAKVILDFINKYFTHASSKEDRGTFDKTVSKAYYNAAMLIDVMGEFGEIDQSLLDQQKFAKYKTTLIHKKNLSTSEIENSKNNSSFFNDGNSKLPKSILKQTSFSSESPSADLKSPSQTNQSDNNSTETLSPNSNEDHDNIFAQNAKDMCHLAVSAIETNDYLKAVEYLDKALRSVKICTPLAKDP